MFTDTHCHINMMVKESFDTPLNSLQLARVPAILEAAAQKNVTRIINVGTSLVESTNCVTLAKQFTAIYAAVGIHPNDTTPEWKTDLKQLELFLQHKIENKVVAIGECGLDFHYPDYDKQRQKDAFKAQIELSLEYNVGLVVHTRDAHEETLRILEEYRNDITRGIIHCFSEDEAFAKAVWEWGYCIGIGGILTYPKNDLLRTIVQQAPLDKIVLETDAPFLPPQTMRGKQNSPSNIALVAEFMAHLRNQPVEEIAQHTEANVIRIFGLEDKTGN